jgi:hypothetical protein
MRGVIAMKASVYSFTISLSIACCVQTHAQISEPPPMAGTFGAGQAATNYAMMSPYTRGTSAATCEARKEWEAYADRRRDCLRATRTLSGKQYYAARERCSSMYPRKKARVASYVCNS